MGFSDRDIVALSGAHTVGRCHKVRSGYDGPWTRKPLKFDNEYFVNLMTLEVRHRPPNQRPCLVRASSKVDRWRVVQWKPRAWDGPLQYTDVATESLTMLPTDMALRTDPAFKVIADEYAKDQAAFFRDFSSAFSRLVAKGCPVSAQPAVANSKCPRAAASAEMRELAMHGALPLLTHRTHSPPHPRILLTLA
jgi:catalase (peroxidase I)